MAFPLRKDVPDPWIDEPYEGELILRPTLGADGQVHVLQLPPTRENLLDPRLEDKVTQNNAHARLLSPLAVALRMELEGREEASYGLFEDLLLLLQRHPSFDHDVAPDITVVTGIEDPEQVDESLDVVAEDLEIPLVMEVVSTKYKTSRDKDEIDNVPVYDRLGARDYVMVYPQVLKRGEPLRLAAMTRDSTGAFVDNPPNHWGRIQIHSLDLWIFVDGEGRLALQDIKTKKRIWFHVDEKRLRLVAEQRAVEQEQRAEKEAEARRESERRTEKETEARREAERRAEEEARRRLEAEQRIKEQARDAEIAAQRQAAKTVVMILESRNLTVTDEDRQRIFACLDMATLHRWTVSAVQVQTVDDLWTDP